jgi:hypothetical protein
MVGHTLAPADSLLSLQWKPLGLANLLYIQESFLKNRVHCITHNDKLKNLKLIIYTWTLEFLILFFLSFFFFETGSY